MQHTSYSLTLSDEQRHNLENITRDVLQRLLGGLQIKKIEISATTDQFDDEVLRVKVILDGDEINELRNLAGVTRRLRPRFSEIGEQRFPVMSFIAASEVGAYNSEAY